MTWRGPKSEAMASILTKPQPNALIKYIIQYHGIIPSSLLVKKYLLTDAPASRMHRRRILALEHPKRPCSRQILRPIILQDVPSRRDAAALAWTAYLRPIGTISAISAMVVIDVAGGLASFTSVTPKSSGFCQQQASINQLKFGIFLGIIDVNLRFIISYLRSSKLACVVGLQTPIVVSRQVVPTYLTYLPYDLRMVG